MSNSLQLSEIAIALAAKDLNPAVLNPDFLKYTGIIPTDWELANQPIYNNNLVQLVYKNGVGIIVQPNRLNVLEMIGGKAPAEIQLATVALQLIEKLSQIEYQAVGINPKAFVNFPSVEDAYNSEVLNVKILRIVSKLCIGIGDTKFDQLMTLFSIDNGFYLGKTQRL
ncbi:hypothetical protein H6G30_16490 [Aphanizomenon sp. FACHB-1401]|uniref:hypothetical protein n=1 Tax=Aphanizomenon sp. FACHB-1401 TaxID=2692774 RepID=UPI001683C879|nr:hypothetical protein [Aphanizomenon sp. FACHB-1401]MBD2643993.1 hypothetical protein [Aphanizomenon sp. FACHB-1401]